MDVCASVIAALCGVETGESLGFFRNHPNARDRERHCLKAIKWSIIGQDICYPPILLQPLCAHSMHTLYIHHTQTHTHAHTRNNNSL